MPEWFSEWYQFVAVQLAGLAALAVAIWKWLTKPLRDNSKDQKRAHIRLKRFVKRNSFQWRTWVATATRHKMETEHKIEVVERQLEGLLKSADRVEKVIESGLSEVRDRLTSIETEVRIRVEHSKGREDDKR